MHKKIVEFLQEHPGYIKKAANIVLERLNIPQKPFHIELVKMSQRKLRNGRITPSLFKNKKAISDPPKLFFDIETSPNIVYSWNIGPKINLQFENIIKERAIICICYKWEGESQVYELHWDNGNDKFLLEKFAKVLNSSPIIVGHNLDSYDTKWVRARCLYHGIPLKQKFNSIDTLKMSRAQFRLNSNKLDYIAQHLGLGRKVDTGGFKLWKDIMNNNNKTALQSMISYCKGDVILTEKVYKKLQGYSPEKKFKNL